MAAPTYRLTSYYQTFSVVVPPLDSRSFVKNTILRGAVLMYDWYWCLTLERTEMSTGYTWSSRSNLQPTFLISDIRTLWRSALSAKVNNVG